MDRLTQEAKARQAVVECGNKKGKSYAAQKYGASLSSVKRWVKRYDGTWQSLRERSHRPHSHPKRHTAEEEAAIRAAFGEKYMRFGWDGVYDELVKNQGYTRSLEGMYRAATRMGLGRGKKGKPPRKHDRRYPELTAPGEKVQIDVKEVPYSCLKGAAKRDEKHLYQWTAIDECTRLRYVFGYWEHTPENSVDFLKRLQTAFPFPIQTVQTDNGTEFTYRFISEGKACPFEKALEKAGMAHKLIAPRTPWHNGKVERSHRNDQRYFYDWERFGDVDELNKKLAAHLVWSNNKTMRTLGRKSPLERLAMFWQAA
jgi:transposase InsO family protein